MWDSGYSSEEETKARQSLRKAWLKYYSDWEGSHFRRDCVIANKVKMRKTPPVK